MAKETAQRKLTKKLAVAVAQKQFDQHQPRKYRLVARADRMERIDGYWYIEVQPVPENVSTGDFIQRMVEAQMELEDQGFRVELTNMLPCDVMKAEMLLPRFAQALTARNGPRRKRKTA